jgi:hypothetical protein
MRRVLACRTSEQCSYDRIRVGQNLTAVCIYTTTTTTTTAAAAAANNNNVAYLPHARTVESQKPRNTHATIERDTESTRC